MHNSIIVCTNNIGIVVSIIHNKNCNLLSHYLTVYYPSLLFKLLNSKSLKPSAKTYEGRTEQKTAFFYFDLNLQKIEEAHQSNPWTLNCWRWWRYRLLKSSLVLSLSMQGVSSHHYKTCTSVMNWARWKLYWWTSTSLWACCSHLLQDLIELQVTRAPITSDSEVSLRDRDVMSSAKGRHCASALTDSSSSALPRIPNSSFLQPLHFKSNFFLHLGLYLRLGCFFPVY